MHKKRATNIFCHSIWKMNLVNCHFFQVVTRHFEIFSENGIYPYNAKNDFIEGTVIETFVIEADGTLTDIKILRGIGGGCDEESIRVVKLMPKWKAGKLWGKPVRVQYNLPVKFILQ